MYQGTNNQQYVLSQIQKAESFLNISSNQSPELFSVFVEIVG